MTPEAHRSNSETQRRTRSRGSLRSPTDALYRGIRWVVRHVRTLYGALGLFLVVGLMVAGGAILLLAWLAEGVMAGATQQLDQLVVEWMRARTHPWLDGAALIGIALGSGLFTWSVLGAGTLLLWLTRHRYSVLLLWLSLGGGRLLSRMLKSRFDRPRPRPIDWELEFFGRSIHFPSSPSFPSGHALTSVIVFGTLAYLVVRLEPTVRLRRVTLVLATGLILLVSLSRVYLGVHYPSDVLAGLLAGLVWVIFSAFSIELLRYFAAGRPELRRAEQDVDKGLDPLRETWRRHPRR